MFQRMILACLASIIFCTHCPNLTGREIEPPTMLYLSNVRAASATEYLAQIDIADDVQIAADETLNALIVKGSEKSVASVQRLVERLDRPDDPEADSFMQIYSIDFDDSDLVFQVLQTMLEGSQTAKMDVSNDQKSLILYGNENDHKIAGKAIEQLRSHAKVNSIKAMSGYLYVEICLIGDSEKLREVYPNQEPLNAAQKKLVDSLVKEELVSLKSPTVILQDNQQRHAKKSGRDAAKPTEKLATVTAKQLWTDVGSRWSFRKQRHDFRR